jgi:ATPase subunit of ABC transporter with duplicated ATPase domains
VTANKVVQEHAVIVVEKRAVDGEGQDKPGRYARSLLHLYLFSGDEVFTPVERLSYGERARLVLARLVLSGATLVLLDEPTNHLSMAYAPWPSAPLL